MGYVLSETLVWQPVYALNLTAETRAVLQEAIEAWNGKSNYTRTYFERDCQEFRV